MSRYTVYLIILIIIYSLYYVIGPNIKKCSDNLLIRNVSKYNLKKNSTNLPYLIYIPYNRKDLKYILKYAIYNNKDYYITRNSNYRSKLSHNKIMIDMSKFDKN